MIRHAVLAVLMVATITGEPVSGARAYVGTALSLLQQYSVETRKADWPKLRGEAHRATANARQPADTYPAIRRVIEELGNPHTVLLTPSSPAASLAVREVPGGRMIGSTAYVKLPWTSDDGQTYVDSGRYLLRDLVAARPSGWVVDLRGNRGGDVHPMLTVVAPLLGEGKTGSFVFPNGTTTEWGIHNGHVHVGDTISFPQVEMPPAVRGPVAVLVDGGTASSGEAVLIAFTGADGTRSFGEPTAGLATSNQVFPLPDGARLAITTSHMADRTGHIYGNAPIAPQTPVSGSGATDDRVLGTAIAWLATQRR